MRAVIGKSAGRFRSSLGQGREKGRSTSFRKASMKKLTIGDVTVTSIIERDGPWRRPEDMFPAYDPDIGRRHLAELDPEVFA